MTTDSGWWLTYPPEKYMFVSWDDDIPMESHKIPAPNISKPPTRIVWHVRFLSTYLLGVLSKNSREMSWNPPTINDHQPMLGGTMTTHSCPKKSHQPLQDGLASCKRVSLFLFHPSNSRFRGPSLESRPFYWIMNFRFVAAEIIHISIYAHDFCSCPLLLVSIPISVDDKITNLSLGYSDFFAPGRWLNPILVPNVPPSSPFDKKYPTFYISLISVDTHKKKNIKYPFKIAAAIEYLQF